MIRAVFVVFLIVFAGGSAPAAEPWEMAPSREIWIANRSDGNKGTGSQNDPFDGSTAAKMSALLHGLSNYQVPNVTVHFQPGTYLTSGSSYDWCVSTHWTLVGAGEGRTIIKIDPNSLTYTGASKVADPRFGLFENGKGHVTVQDLTVDGSATGFGTALTASFQMPAGRDPAGVLVAVADAHRFDRAIGRWVLLEQSPQTRNGQATDYGLMQVLAVPDDHHLRLMNSAVNHGGTVTGVATAGSAVITNLSSTENLDQGQAVSSPGNLPNTVIRTVDSSQQMTVGANALASGPIAINYSPAYLPGRFCTHISPQGNVPAGAVVPASAYVLLEIHLCGVVAGRPGDRIDHVTVQNVEQPYYEGPTGIGFDSYGSKVGPEIIENCTVKDIWGTCGWVISMSNPTDPEVAGNKVYGNGWSDGYSMGGAARARVHDNRAFGVYTGFFSDVGPSSYSQIENNTFSAHRGMQMSGGVVLDHCTIANNHITVTAKDGIGLFIIAVTTSTAIKGNVISALPEALPGAFGLQCRSGEVSGTMFGDTTAGSPALTNLSNVAYLWRHTAVKGPGLPPDAQVSNTPGAHPSSATLDQPATATATGIAMTYGPIIESNIVADNHVQFGLLNYRCPPRYGVQSGNTVGTDNNGGVKTLDLGLPPAAPPDNPSASAVSIPSPKLPPASSGDAP